MQSALRIINILLRKETIGLSHNIETPFIIHIVESVIVAIWLITVTNDTQTWLVWRINVTFHRRTTKIVVFITSIIWNRLIKNHKNRNYLERNWLSWVAMPKLYESPTKHWHMQTSAVCMHSFHMKLVEKQIKVSCSKVYRSASIKPTGEEWL